MNVLEDQSTNDTKLENKIRKSLSEYIKSNSNVFATKELRMIARIRNIQPCSNVSVLENVVAEEREQYSNIYESKLQSNNDIRRNAIMCISEFINRAFRLYSGCKMSFAGSSVIPVIKFTNDTYILLENPFNESLPEKIEEKILQFQIADDELNSFEKNYIGKIKGVWQRW